MDIFTNLSDFNSRPLAERLELLRKEYCTGPCGQSNSVLARREALSRALKEAREIAAKYEHHSCSAEVEKYTNYLKSRGEETR